MILAPTVLFVAIVVQAADQGERYLSWSVFALDHRCYDCSTGGPHRAVRSRARAHHGDRTQLHSGVSHSTGGGRSAC